MVRGTKHSNEWPPAKYRLPDTVEEIERGRIKQQKLFDNVRDNSKAARLDRLLADIPGVVTADTLTGGMRSSSLENGRLLTVV